MNTATLERPAVSAHDAPTMDRIERLKVLLRQNRRRWRAVIALEAVGLAIALPLAYIWLVFFLDTQLYLPLIGRVFASVGVIAGVVWAVRYLMGRWRQLHLSEDEVALAIERQTPGHVQNRLINAIQLARCTVDDAHRLSDAVIQENYDRLQQVHLEQAAKLRPAIVRAALAAVMIVIGVGLFLWEPERFANSAARILLPLAPIDPLYRTRLEVDPGDVEATGDIKLTISIAGERPETLAILKRSQGKVTSETVAVPAGSAPVTHWFRDVSQRFDYAVRGGDFTTPFYQVIVPQKITLARVRVTYQYPEYTALDPKTAEGTAGDLEALQGTRAQVVFVLDQPADRVAVLLDGSGKTKGAKHELKGSDDGREFAGEIAIDQAPAYRLEVGQGHRQVQKLGPYPIRILKDQEPKLELAGLERRTDVQVDSVLPLKITASDDFGLVQVGLVFRRVLGVAGKGDEPWETVDRWDTGRKAAFQMTYELPVARLNVAEGEKVELALRAIDTDPARQGAWTTGAAYELTVGGDGAGLQRQYEQILRSEAELKGLIAAEQAQLGNVLEWLKKLDGQGDLRWDDPKNVEMLHQAVQKLSTDQAAVQKLAGPIVRAMLSQAGNVRIALGLLADTEMVRVQRILDTVPGKEMIQAKRAAIADARVTQERIVRSMHDLAEQYVNFRVDWETANMIPFTKMLAERQTKMRDSSRQLAATPSKGAEAFHRQSMERRQVKVLDLCKLIAPAFTGIADRIEVQDVDLGKACRAASVALASAELHQPMRDAGTAANAGRWSEVARHQTTAAQALTDLHGRLRDAQLAAAQKALAALKEKAKSDLLAQKELEKLQPGSSENFVKNFPDGFKLEDTVRIWEVAGRKKAPGDGKEDPDFKKSQLADFYDKNKIELKEDSGVRQDTSTLTLGKVAEKTAPLQFIPTDKEKNKVKPFIQEQYDDLVGKLLEEADELHKNYQSLNLSTNQNNNDPGDIGKQGGALNSTGAVAATGNKKPPTLESGGVSRTGRQGARAYGMVADQDTFNRKGRDQALEGQAEVADQAGKNKMHKTDENQTDFSTGVGGKKIESEDSHFSLHDAGKWKDEYAKRMEKPQKKEFIVERQGDKFDAKMAAQLRDLTSQQEQVIERLKSIKKELKNLYLPTEHLDELAAALQANLDSLKERPEPELFRLQLQALDRLRGSLRLFQSAGASFQPSLPRERVINGRVLDEPDRPALPGYEEAVRQYYLKLATK